MGTAYWIAVGIGVTVIALACTLARRPGAVRVVIGRAIALLLAADAVVFVLRPMFDGEWTVRGSLPLDLCDVALGVAAITCWWPRWRLGVELTWFWGMAGTLQALATPDLNAYFPSLTFFQFVVGHIGIVFAALYLVIGLRLTPRLGAVPRVFAVTLGYTALVAIVDALTGANYMFLARAPAHASLLSLLGAWPWYIASAAGVALVLFLVLDLPFRARRADALTPGRTSASRWPRRRRPVPRRSRTNSGPRRGTAPPRRSPRTGRAA